MWLLALVPLAIPHPANPKNITLYAIRPMALVDITDRDSADVAGDVRSWVSINLTASGLSQTFSC